MPSRFLFDPPRPRPKKTPANIKSLLVRCPSTSRLTDTGRTIDENLCEAASVKRQKLSGRHCGKVHSWEKADVVLGRPLA